MTGNRQSRWAGEVEPADFRRGPFPDLKTGCQMPQRIVIHYPLRLFLFLGCLLSLSEHAQARVIHVNNSVGSDRYNGVFAEAINAETGPVASIGKALRLAGPSDVISIADTGVPYYEALSLVGTRHSGTAQRPFTILGNGATLSGVIAVPETAWQQVGDELWQLKPHRKGLYQLILDSKAVSEVRPAEGQNWTAVPPLPVGTWCAFRGAIYYHAEPRVEPESMNFGIARKSCGITLYGVKNVLVENLKVEHFRVDGVNANDRATDVVLRGVSLVENARSGLTIAGTSLVAVVQCQIERNREYSILLKEAAALVVQETLTDVEPTQE